jgi:hypothetical protein
MALLLRFGFAAQVIVAFVIFVLGYIGLFVSLMLVILVVRGLYESVKWVHAWALRRVDANHSTAATTAAGAFDRRFPLLVTSPANEPQRAELTFHPALHRPGVTGNYSSNLPGGTPR